MIPRDAKVWIAGHKGLAGSALTRLLEAEGFTQVIKRTSKELDLTDQSAVREFFREQKPEYIFLAAAKVGGIVANMNDPVGFLFRNIQIHTNVIEGAAHHGVKKLLFLGSSCVYPKLAPQPIQEDSLLSGPLEASNRSFAIAKIAGLEMCRACKSQLGLDSVSLMPSNLYGPGDNYDPETSHVLGALIRKMHDAKVNNTKEVTLWGTGSPRREFLYSDDLARAALVAMEADNAPDLMNVGPGEDIPIRELVGFIQKAVGFEGEVIWDTTRPDGTPRKLLDVSKIHSLGWKHQVELEEGIQRAYASFMAGV